ncbi:MAG: hypothetical protein IPK10_06205 [Bacteroidetes bacterium]|nr:hypothetical protein [Bacteroidota bacterium]
MIAKKQAEFYFVAERENAQSVVEVTRLDPTWMSLAMEAPAAFLRTLFLPMPHHAHNMLMWFSVLENFFILGIIVLLIFSFKKQKLPHNFGLILAFFIFGCTIFILSGWVTPIIGALVRYKVPGLPFFLFPLTLFSYKNWMSGSQFKWFKSSDK